MDSPKYDDDKLGMEFEETDETDALRGLTLEQLAAKRRRIRISKDGRYFCFAIVEHGRGLGQKFQIWNKNLVDPKKWTRVR